ncbi:MAG: aminopeptidase [Candidatus Nanohaloarchaea archaeon]
MESTEDKRIKKFATTLIERNNIEKGDRVYLLAKSLEALPLFEEVRRQLFLLGAHPQEHLLYDCQNGYDAMDHDYLKYSSEEDLQKSSRIRMNEMEEVDAYIRIGGETNHQELSDIDPEKISMVKEANREIKMERFRKKWIATRFPTSGFAQRAGMSTQEMENFIFRAVNATDWDRMKKKNSAIKKRFDRGEKVRILSEDTDIEFSIEGREGINSHGRRNMPDGEVYYAPRKYSVEGEINFTYTGVLNGQEVEDVSLEFEDGKIVEFDCRTNREFLESMINSDEGSRYLGEFGIGTNPYIQRFVKSTMLDEKIAGSIHLAVGNAYEMTVDEGERNDSAIHWDLIKDLRDKKDGGKIILDGETVQEDGEWLFDVPELN